VILLISRARIRDAGSSIDRGIRRVPGVLRAPSSLATDWLAE